MDNDNILDQIFNGHDDLLEDVLGGDYEIRTGRKPVEEMEVRQDYFLTQDETLPSMARLNGRWVKIKDSVLGSLRSIASSYYGDEASRILSGFKFRMHEAARTLPEERTDETVDVAEQLIDMLERTGSVIVNEGPTHYSPGEPVGPSDCPSCGSDSSKADGLGRKCTQCGNEWQTWNPGTVKRPSELGSRPSQPYATPSSKLLRGSGSGGSGNAYESIDEGNNNSLPDGTHHDTNSHPAPNAGLRLQTLYHSIGTILPELHALVTSCIGEERAALTMLFNEVMTAHSEIGNYLSCTNQAPDPQIESLLSHYSTVHSQIMDALNPYSTHNLAVATGPYQLKGTHLNDSEGEQSLPFARARR